MIAIVIELRRQQPVELRMAKFEFKVKEIREKARQIKSENPKPNNSRIGESRRSQSTRNQLKLRMKFEFFCLMKNNLKSCGFLSMRVHRAKSHDIMWSKNSVWTIIIIARELNSKMGISVSTKAFAEDWWSKGRVASEFFQSKMLAM